jgi:acetyl-CoA decarbonylase/synthase complex subunit delta
LAFQINTVKYAGNINQTPLGVSKVLLGGQAAYPFHDFEGALPNKPKLGLQVWDMDPGESFAPPLAEAYAGCLGDPGAWAKKAVEYGADLISLHLKSSDPNDLNTGPQEAIAATAKVLEAVNVPVIVFGVDNPDKDKDTLSAVAEKFSDKKLILGPVTDKNYKQVGAQALAYGHSVIARTPIDVNLAKQLNILLMDLGITTDRILIDPNTGGIGYGMEYCYSVMERINMAALIQKDDKLQQPIINILGEEIWKLKEVNQLTAEYPTLGDQLSRGVLMEVTEAVSLLSAGSSLLVMAHPTSLKLVREYIDLVSDGGAPSGDVKLDVPITDLSSIADIKAEPKAAAEAKAAEPKAAEAKAAEPKAAEPKAAEPKAAEPKADEAKAKAEKEAKAKADEEAKAKAAADAEAKAKAKAEEEAKAKAAAEAEAKAKAEEEAKAKAEEEAKAKAAAEAEAKAKAKAEEEAKAKAAADAKAKAEADAKAKADAEAKAKAAADAKAKADAEAKAKAKAAEEAKAKAADSQADQKPASPPKPVRDTKKGERVMTAQESQTLVVEKPEEIVSNQIINELDRVHMRIPRY